MTIALAPILFAQAATPAAAAALDDPVRALAERLRAIEVAVGQDHTGTWHCSLSAGTGSARVDDLLCRATTECARQHGNDRDQLGWCLDQRRTAILEEFRRTSRRSRG